MKLKDFLKQFENLDPEIEVNEYGKPVPKIEIAYQEGYAARSLKLNPYEKGSEYHKLFVAGFNDKNSDLDDEIYYPDC